MSDNNGYADLVRAALGVIPPLQVKIFTAEQAAHYEVEWQNLSQRALERNVFYEPAFALAAVQHLAEAGQPSFIFVFEGREILTPGCRIAAIFPFTTSKLDFGIPILRGWRHPFNPRGTPLVDARLAAPAILSVFKHLEDTPYGNLLLSTLPEDGPFSYILKTVLMERGADISLIAGHERAILCAGPSPDEYFAQNWRQKKLKELQRQRRRLAEMGALDWRSIQSVPDICEAIERFLVLEAAGWKGLKGSALLQDAGRATFLRSMTRGLAQTQQIQVDEFYSGNELLASGISLLSGDTRAFWKIAYNERFARYSPGVLFTQELTRQALLVPQLRRIDSCAIQDHPMINHLWHERMPIADWMISLKPSSLLAHKAAVLREKTRLSGKQFLKRQSWWRKPGQ